MARWRGRPSRPTARGHAALLFESRPCRFAQEIGTRGICLVAPCPATARSPPCGGEAIWTSLRLARSSEGASFVYWRGIVKQEIEAGASRRSAAAMERVVRRFARMSVTGSSPGGATCVQTFWQRKNSGSWPETHHQGSRDVGPQVRSRCLPLLAKAALRQESRTRGPKGQNACGARSGASRRACPALFPPMAQQRSNGSGVTRRAPALRNAVLRWNTIRRSVWNLGGALHPIPQELSLHFLERQGRAMPRSGSHKSFGLAPQAKHGRVGRRGCSQAQIRGAFVVGCAMCLSGRRGGPTLGGATASVVTS